MKTKLIQGVEVGVRTKDISGEYFGKLLAIKPVGKKGKTSNLYWEFLCLCGEKIERCPQDLNDKSSCRGCRYTGKNIEGKRYGKLVALSSLDKSGNKDYNWLCKCDCGNEHITTIGRLQWGHTTSCGCIRKEVAKSRKNYHGMQGTLVYNSWRKIKERCLNENDIMYPQYGAKGIGMQDNWQNSFKDFYEYIGDPPDDGNVYRSIDRIDNTKGYFEGNIRWATTQMQARNKGKCVLNTTGVTGVHWDLKTSHKGKYVTKYAVARWTTIDGQPRKKSFSVKKYGEEEAFRLACEAREKAIKELNLQGAGYTENHGK